MGKLTEEEILKEIDLETDVCICCHANQVEWPLVCERCQNKEKQEELFQYYCEKGLAGEFDPETGEEKRWCKMICQYCGMIHDGGLTCYYCGSLNPTDEINDEGDYFDDDLDFFNVDYLQNGELFEDDV